MIHIIEWNFYHEQGVSGHALWGSHFAKCNSENMTPRKYEIVNRNIIKAQDIIIELWPSIMEEVEKLLNASVFISTLEKKTLEANIQKDSKTKRSSSNSLS